MGSHSQRDSMENEKNPDLREDNLDSSRHSLRSTKKDSRASSVQKHKKNKIQGKEGRVESRSKTQTRCSDSDRDRISDGEGRRSDGSFYSEDYEQATPSERSLSSFSRSRTPSLTPQRGVRTKRASRSFLHKTGGAGRWGASHSQRLGNLSLTQQHRRGVRSQSKESTPPKDLDLVTKRMLSARLLKINELRNALSELQYRNREIQRENQILRQLQVRQEKALQRYDDTESEISQLLSRHSNETHVLRERLRRSQEQERAAERRFKDSEEQLQKSRLTITRLKKLVTQRELGTRDELNRSLEEEKTRAQDAERKIKELERSVELTSSSYQRQLVAEKRKTISAQEEIRALQEELDRLTSRLKEKERELDVRNIYANRIVKPSVRKETENGTNTKRKATSRNSTKAVQTEDRAVSLDFPTPPPAISDADGDSEQAHEEYLSLKELDKVDRPGEPENDSEKQKWEKEKAGEKELVKERELEMVQKHSKEPDVLERKANRFRDGSEMEKDEEEERKRTSSLFSQKEEETYWKHSHVQEEVPRWNQEPQSHQQAAEEARRKKEQLLAKMREIDRQNQGAQDSMFIDPSPSEPNKSTSNHFSPHPPEQRKNSSIFSLTESAETSTLPAGSGENGRRRSGTESGAITAGMGRRNLRSQTSSEDLAFGGYLPSFGHSVFRASSGFPPPPPKEDRDSPLEAIGIFNFRGVAADKDKEEKQTDKKDKKSNLLQQLFGPQAILAGDNMSVSNKTEVLGRPPTPNGVRSRREGLLSFSSGSSTPPASAVNTLQVADSRPAVRAITSFDDDIEELAL
ncbi:lebercilin isoform 1-T1 [Menidia menidia]